MFEDHLAALEADSARVGTQGGDLIFALLLDGLSAEREQGITIDVAYRFFSTERRKFIVADTPGHEQYTRNMVTGASTADVAVILVDARKGVLTQTRRHSFLVSLLGIRHVVVAINKMDLVDYSPAVFDADRGQTTATSPPASASTDITFIPLSALEGDNVVAPEPRHTHWYHGPTLHGLPRDGRGRRRHAPRGPFRMPVQWVNRPNLDFRGFSGRIVGGRSGPATPCGCCRPAPTSPVARIVTSDGDLTEAVAGQSVTITLTDEIDASRGDVIWRRRRAAAEVADQFEAHVVWMHEDAMLPGRPYLMKIGTRTVGADDRPPEVPDRRQQPRPPRGHHARGSTRSACATSHLDRPIPFDPYADNRDIGGFVIIDKLTQDTVGAGLLHFALRRAHNIHWQQVQVDKAARGGAEPAPPRRRVVHWAVRVPASRRSPTSSSRSCTRSARARTCSTATTCATASTATSASPTPTGWRTSAASPRWRR